MTPQEDHELACAADPCAPDAVATWRRGAARHAKGHDYAPCTAEMSQLVAEARAALGDAARVERQLLAGGEEGLTEPQLRRWLRARGWDPARAARDLAAHAAWRAQFAPLGRVQESEVAREIAQGKVFLQGPDGKGRGVTIFIGGNHHPRVDPTECHRFIYYAIDATLAAADRASNPAVKTTGVLCMRDFGWKNFDIMGGINIARAVHHHYVERLDKLFIHGTSAAFQRAYHCVEPFIDPVTRAKVVLLPKDEGEARRILDEEIGLEHLPPFLGGTAEPRPIQDACAQLLPRWAAERDVAERAAGLCGGAAAAPAGSGEGLEEGDDDDEAEFFDTASEDEGEERCAASGAGAAAGRPE